MSQTFPGAAGLSGRTVVWNRSAVVSGVLWLLNVALFVVDVVAGPLWPRAFNWVTALFIISLTLFECRRADLDGGGSRAAARFWRQTTVGMAIMLAFNVTGLVNVASGDHFPLIGAILQGIGALFLGFAVLRLPLGTSSRTGRLALLLDCCTVLAAAAILLWHFFGTDALDTLVNGEAPNLGALFTSGLVGVFLAVKAALSGTTVLPRPTLYLTAFSALAGGLGVAVGLLVAKRPDIDATVLLGPTAALGVLVSARFAVVDRADRSAVGSPRRYSVLPYVAAGLAVTLLVYTSVRDTPDRTAVALACALITALVCSRQLIVFRENSALLVRIEDEEHRFRALVQHASEIVSVFAADGTIYYSSPAMHRLLGHDPAVLLGSGLRHLIHEDDLPHALAELDRIGTEPGVSVRYEIRMRHADGSWRWFDVITTNMFHEPSIGGRVSNSRDITDTRAAQDQLSHDATHDALTGLANRVLFGDRLERIVTRPGPGHRFSIVLIDLDDFKIVNDTLGHAAGDALLVAVAQRMKARVRAGDTVARLGGDEFAILFEGLGPDAVENVLHRIAVELLVPVDVDGHQLPVRASFGLVEGGSGDDAGDLLRRADIAMYEAKDQGKGGLRRYEPGMEARGAGQARFTAELATAIETGQLVLHYQPSVSLPDGRITGSQALVRWQHPARGLLDPDEFLPAAEESPLIVGLGRWALRQAVDQAASWLDEFGPDGPGTIAVPVSARQLRDEAYAVDVARALHDGGLPARLLTIEITEATALGGGATERNLRELRALGVRVALDACGTGSSTLGLLSACPVDEIKLASGAGPDWIAGTVLQLARAVGAEAVAGGVETSAQAERLAGLGYRHARGFPYAHPMPAGELTAVFRTWPVAGHHR